MSPHPLKVFGRVGGLGLEMAAYLLIFAKGGQWLDARYGTGPVLERVGVALGLFAGFYALWKLARSSPTSSAAGLSPTEGPGNDTPSSPEAADPRRNAPPP